MSDSQLPLVDHYCVELINESGIKPVEQVVLESPFPLNDTSSEIAKLWIEYR